MKILAEINDKTIGIGEGEILGAHYELRKSARAILMDGEGNMAAQYLNTYSFHKLPGGGLEKGETIEDACKREILEEVGCKCDLVEPLGIVVEYRNKYNLIQISYAFEAKVSGEIGEAKLEEAEIKEGLETIWLTPGEVLQKMENDNPEKYEAQFILEREKSFLREYLDK